MKTRSKVVTFKKKMETFFHNVKSWCKWLNEGYHSLNFPEQMEFLQFWCK